MNIDITNPDTAYTSCKALNDLVKGTGEELIDRLRGNITSLKSNWIGADATTHINNLIKVYNALVQLVTESKGITKAAGDAMIKVQDVRNTNNYGSGTEVGAALDGNEPTAPAIEEAPMTDRYYTADEAKNDHTTLVAISDDYETFVNDFIRDKDELFENWHAGCNHDQAVNSFDNFVADSNTYKTYLTNARDDLGTAVQNIATIGD